MDKTMTTLKSKTKSGDYQIRFKINNKWIVVTGKTLVQALKAVDQYKSVYL